MLMPHTLKENAVSTMVIPRSVPEVANALTLDMDNAAKIGEVGGKFLNFIIFFSHFKVNEKI